MPTRSAISITAFALLFGVLTFAIAARAMFPSTACGQVVDSVDRLSKADAKPVPSIGTSTGLIERTRLSTQRIGYEVARIIRDPNKSRDVTVIISIKPEYFNRNDMLRLASQLNADFATASKLKVEILDDAKLASSYLASLDQPRRNSARRALYSLDRKKRSEYIKFSTSRGRRYNRINIPSSKIKEKQPASTRANASLPNLSANTSVGSNYLESITADKKGGVWITGNSFMIAGLMLNDNGGQLKAATDSSVNGISEVQFITADIGWMRDIHRLFRTNDGGQTWQAVKLPDGLDLWSFYFTEIGAGWVTGSDGAVYRTADSGGTWQKHDVGLKYVFTEVFFVDSLHGWIWGTESWGESNSALLRTTDGGASWELLSNKPSSQSVGLETFVNATHGWGVDADRYITHTVDGGKTWQRQGPFDRNGWGPFCFVNSTEGWVASHDGILHTSDGGENWELQLETDAFDADSVVDQLLFIDSDRGWAINTERIWRTTDGGETWQEIPRDWRRTLPSYYALARKYQERWTRENQ
jgi:photosystem II stability/assembly factor-like uncharacterized protein